MSLCFSLAHAWHNTTQMFSTRTDAREMCKLILYTASPDRHDTVDQLAGCTDELDRPSFSVCHLCFAL